VLWGQSDSKNSFARGKPGCSYDKCLSDLELLLESVLTEPEKDTRLKVAVRGEKSSSLSSVHPQTSAGLTCELPADRQLHLS